MTDARETLDSLRDENARLQRELQAVRRAQEQTVRMAKRSEALSIQSKRAMLRTHAELERRVEELDAAKVAAEQAAKAKGRFLATMSHELRTPLNGIVGSADLLRATALDDRQRELVELLHRSGLALLSIVNDVLDYSRIEAGRMPIERIAFRTELCVRDVVELQRHVAERKRIDLRIAVAPGVPAVVIGDPGRLRQVLMNLLTNAVKFTGSGTVEVRIDRGQAQDELVFAVADTGIGIPLAAQPSLFDAFAQADASTTRRFGGTGLGLAVSKRLVTLMGGRIALQSAPGQGSTFTFTCVLPAAGAEDLQVGEPGEPKAVPAGRGRILVVDDNPSNRLLVVRMLERLGFDTDVAVDGVEAITHVMNGHYRAVLMDCSMPVMDGYEATRAIRALTTAQHDVPILALTAHSMPEDEARCRACGMDDYLTKPLRLADLAAALARLEAAPAT